MKHKGPKAFGKYVPIAKDGQVRFYLPLEKWADLDGLIASGYEVGEESRGIIRIAGLIREAKGRRAASDRRKRQFVTAALADFSSEAGSIEVLCP